MDEPFFDLVEFLRRPSIAETFVDILLCAVPIWLAVTIGLVIGWSWRPRWTGLVFLGLRSKFRFLWAALLGFGAGRLWIAFTAFSFFSVCRTIWSNFGRKSKGSAPTSKLSIPGFVDGDAVGRVFFNRKSNIFWLLFIFLEYCCECFVVNKEIQCLGLCVRFGFANFLIGSRDYLSATDLNHIMLLFITIC